LFHGNLGSLKLFPLLKVANTFSTMKILSLIYCFICFWPCKVYKHPILTFLPQKEKKTLKNFSNLFIFCFVFMATLFPSHLLPPSRIGLCQEQPPTTTWKEKKKEFICSKTKESEHVSCGFLIKSSQIFCIQCSKCPKSMSDVAQGIKGHIQGHSDHVFYQQLTILEDSWIKTLRTNVR